MSDDGILEPLDELADQPTRRSSDTVDISRPGRDGREPNRSGRPRRPDGQIDGQMAIPTGVGDDGILESLDELAEAPTARLNPVALNRRSNDGILETLDDIDSHRTGLARRELFVEPGVKLEHTPSRTRGTVVRFLEGVEIVLRDQLGGEQSFDPTPGLFRHDGDLVALRSPLTSSAETEPDITASGSIAATDTTARVARPSRIWVEGIHDAELIERVWGDDLRYEGIVVEQLEGADDLQALVQGFGPSDSQRLGVLLDHLIDGTKESRIAATIDDPNVLILGHPYVDIWQAVKPAVAGFDAWPTVPKGEPWKQGVLSRLGLNIEPPQFWKHLLGRVSSWNDIETPLVNSVEQLIDFVTETV